MRALPRHWPSVSCTSRSGCWFLSHYLDSRYAIAFAFEQHPGGAGYLLKERVSDVVVLVDALRRIADGECVVDPTIVARLLARRRAASPLAGLTSRERDVLALIAEGHSNQAISARLVLSPKTVERHIGHIFGKLGLIESDQYPPPGTRCAYRVAVNVKARPQF